MNEHEPTEEEWAIFRDPMLTHSDALTAMNAIRDKRIRAEAADTIDALTAERDRLRDALEKAYRDMQGVSKDTIDAQNDTLQTVAAWLERWAVHVGNCRGGDRCECGLTRVRYEVDAALAKAKGTP